MNIKETNLSFKSMSVRSKTNRIILHHAAAKSCGAATIHQWHLNNGWSGIGYHFVVRKDGTIERGRPEKYVGAHAEGSNSDSIGICFEGDFMTETMSETQKNAGKELVTDLKNKYGISKVQKHSDVCSTDCPGENFPFSEIAGATGSTGSGSSSNSSSSKAGKLTVDGWWGPKTTRRLQQIFGTTVDGVVSNQFSCYKAQNPGLDSGWEWESNPSGYSPLIKAIQKKVGATQDGHIGPKTIKAIQKWLGCTQDGVFSGPSPCIKKLQQWINKQK